MDASDDHAADRCAPWQATAAYLYVLLLDDPALAWEYLRRDPGYCACWHAIGRQGEPAAAHRWGLEQLEDPELDARCAHPVWNDSLPSLLHIRIADDEAGGAGLDLWHIPGRKDIAVTPRGLALQVSDGARILRARLDPGVLDGQPAMCIIPLDARLHPQAAMLFSHAAHFAPRRVSPAGHRPAATTSHGGVFRYTQAAQQHLRALQALDGHLAGASQRAIGEALYGREQVCGGWHADSALRAQVRYNLVRGLALMRDGYWALAGLCPASSTAVPAQGENPPPS